MISWLIGFSWAALLHSAESLLSTRLRAWLDRKALSCARFLFNLASQRLEPSPFTTQRGGLEDEPSWARANQASVSTMLANVPLAHSGHMTRLVWMWAGNKQGPREPGGVLPWGHGCFSSLKPCFPFFLRMSPQHFVDEEKQPGQAFVPPCFLCTGAPCCCPYHILGREAGGVTWGAYPDPGSPAPS